MKRHAALRGLSREHQPALAFARALCADTPPRLASARPALPADAVEWALAVWQTELSVHFLVEERELVPLGLSFNQDLRANTERVLEDHREIRRLIRQLGAAGWADHVEQAHLSESFDALGRMIEAHVRFEERTWFAALEQALGADALAELAFRLQLIPEVAVTGFHTDGAEDWVADLNCGHTRHVRHRPPFQEAAWVGTAAGRDGHIGVRYPCPKCRMPRLPSSARVYKELSEFDEVSVPKGLLKSHTLRAGVWGEIQVLSGHLTYVIEDEGDVNIVLAAGTTGIVAPERPHHIALTPRTRVKVRFLKID